MLSWEVIFLIGYVQKEIYYGVKISLWDELKPDVPLLRTHDESSDDEQPDEEKDPPKSKLDTLRIPKPEEQKLRAEFYRYQYVVLQKIKVIKERVIR